MFPPSRRINYDKVLRQIGEIRQLAGDTKKVAEELNSTMTETTRVWKSDAANSFLGECEIIRVSIVGTANSMENLANSINSVAGKIQNEDTAKINRYYEEKAKKSSQLCL